MSRPNRINQHPVDNEAKILSQKIPIFFSSPHLGNFSINCHCCRYCSVHTIRKRKIIGSGSLSPSEQPNLELRWLRPPGGQDELGKEESCRKKIVGGVFSISAALAARL